MHIHIRRNDTLYKEKKYQHLNMYKVYSLSFYLGIQH